MGEEVDFLLRAFLGDGDEEAFLHLRVVADEGKARREAFFQQAADHAVGGDGEFEDELVEEVAFSEAHANLRDGLEALRRIRGFLSAGDRELAEALLAEKAQEDECGQGAESLIRADVGGRLLPSDVLLARLEGEDEALPSLGVHGAAGDAPGHLAHVLATRGHEAQIRSAE